MNNKKGWIIKFGALNLEVTKIMTLLMASLLVTNSYAEITKRTVIGTPTTGMNRKFADPIADFGGRVGEFGFITIAKYNENGNVIPIAGPLPDSTLIASFVDPEWGILTGFPPEVTANPKNNIPMREIPIRIDTSGLNKQKLEPISTVGQMDVGLVTPAYPITLGDWLRVRGRMDLTCYHNKYATVEMKFSGLLPNLVYTLREWVKPETGFNAVPGVFGGAPASFIADINGNGSYSATLPVCPPMTEDDIDHPFFAVALTVTMAHELNGLFPVFPLSSDRSLPGERAFGQLFFPLTGERIVEGAGPVSEIQDWECKEVTMVESDLAMQSPTSSAIGRAILVIDGVETNPATVMDFVRLPTPKADGTLGYMATLSFDFEDGNVLEAFIEGTFIPTANPSVIKIKSVVRFVGGQQKFSPAVGDFTTGGEANLATLNANITGQGEVCTPN